MSRPTAYTKTNPPATAWNKSPVNPTNYVPSSVNATHWNRSDIVATGALLLSTGGLLELSDGNTLGIYEP